MQTKILKEVAESFGFNLIPATLFPQYLLIIFSCVLHAACGSYIPLGPFYACFNTVLPRPFKHVFPLSLKHQVLWFWVLGRREGVGSHHGRAWC